MDRNYISKKQNLPESIELLAAMRQVYNQAKVIRRIRLTITILFPILSVLSTQFFSNEVFFIFFSSIWLILNQTIVQKYEKNQIEHAAKIQESLDVNLFNVEWNEILIGDRPSHEDVLTLSKKFKGDKEKLKDWYQGLESKNHFENVLLAQRTNIVWDKKLRKFYSGLLIFGLIFFLIIILSISFFVDFSFRVFTISLLVPSLPLLLHLFQVATAHKQRYESLARIESKITKEEIEKVSNPMESTIAKNCRQYQDYIYQKRCDINIIPNSVYWIKRNAYDRVAQSVNKKISDYP
ncbi:S-4TM family putative pore-forming effector [Marinilactibacillus psychrotolerans]|uniref:S-4TM family putative pore-forming effector n=1 Tax=Marinilactibacillus psychrotolerans TaxID=191770 RepID=A0ABW8ULN4_9LACT